LGGEHLLLLAHSEEFKVGRDGGGGAAALLGGLLLLLMETVRGCGGSEQATLGVYLLLMMLLVGVHLLLDLSLQIVRVYISRVVHRMCRGGWGVVHLLITLLMRAGENVCELDLPLLLREPLDRSRRGRNIILFLLIPLLLTLHTQNLKFTTDHNTEPLAPHRLLHAGDPRAIAPLVQLPPKGVAFEL
jgi:hypothetical protein